jgi:hypothetical protein
VVLVTLWSWLSSGKGVQVYDDLLPALADAPSRRTVQRWLHRLHPNGVALQQAFAPSSSNALSRSQ